MIERRHEPRTKLDLALQVWGIDSKGERFLQEARARHQPERGAAVGTRSRPPPRGCDRNSLRGQERALPRGVGALRRNRREDAGRRTPHRGRCLPLARSAFPRRSVPIGNCELSRNLSLQPSALSIQHSATPDWAIRQRRLGCGFGTDPQGLKPDSLLASTARLKPRSSQIAVGYLPSSGLSPPATDDSF